MNFTAWLLSASSDTSCHPSEEEHSTTLSLFHYLTQGLEMNFTVSAPFFSPQHRPVVTHPHGAYCLLPLWP